MKKKEEATNNKNSSTTNTASMYCTKKGTEILADCKSSQIMEILMKVQPSGHMPVSPFHYIFITELANTDFLLSG